MAVGTISSVVAYGQKPAEAVYFDLISFAGDSSYPTGGTAAFEASVQAIIGASRDIVACIGQNCGGYYPVYDRANDKLMVYATGNGNKAVFTECDNATNLSGTTFKLLVISA